MFNLPLILCHWFWLHFSEKRSQPCDLLFCAPCPFATTGRFPYNLLNYFDINFGHNPIAYCLHLPFLRGKTAKGFFFFFISRKLQKPMKKLKNIFWGQGGGNQRRDRVWRVLPEGISEKTGTQQCSGLHPVVMEMGTPHCDAFVKQRGLRMVHFH